jgi:hypothetical protein
LGEYHDLGKHTRRVMAQALMGRQPILALIAAALEAMGEEIGPDTNIGIEIVTVRARVMPEDEEMGPEGG